MLATQQKTASAQPYIGGQAVIEGVMMRAPSCASVVVRRPDGSLAVQEGPFQSRLVGSSLWKLPGMRGVATLVESLSLGYRALRFSAEQQLTEEERAQASSASGRGAMVISTMVAIGLFIALPQLLAMGSSKIIGQDFALSDPRYHLIIGGFKLLVVIGYMLAISRLPDVRRVFQYHGAEHKTIYAYEAGLELTVENVRKQSTLHPRCGTTFLLVVIVVFVIVGSALSPLLPNIDGFLGQLMLFGLRLLLIPPVAAISYELQRLSARYCTTGPLRVFLWPGFLVQKITTREPEDDQIEVAIAAMQAAKWREDNADAPVAAEHILFFESFSAFRQALPALRTMPNAAE